MKSNRNNQLVSKGIYLLIAIPLIVFAQVNGVTFYQNGNCRSAMVKNIEKNGIYRIVLLLKCFL